MRKRKTLSALAGMTVMAVATMAQAQTSMTTNPNLLIPDNDELGAEVIINVPADPGGMNIIDDLNVGIIIEHTWQGDLIIELTSPSGTTARLMDRPGVPEDTFGFSADNLGIPTSIPAGASDEFLFDDAMPLAYSSPIFFGDGVDNITGAFLPDTDLLSLFNGQSMVGDWILRVSDNAIGDTGKIDQVSLYFTTAGVPAPGALALLGAAGLLGRRRRRN